MANAVWSRSCRSRRCSWQFEARLGYDISVFKNRGGRRAYNDVISASTQDVIAVMRGGKWLYGEVDALGSWDSSCSDTRGHLRTLDALLSSRRDLGYPDPA